MNFWLVLMHSESSCNFCLILQYLKPDHVKQNLFLISLVLPNLNEINFDLPNAEYTLYKGKVYSY